MTTTIYKVNGREYSVTPSSINSEEYDAELISERQTKLLEEEKIRDLGELTRRILLSQDINKVSVNLKGIYSLENRRTSISVRK